MEPGGTVFLAGGSQALDQQVADDVDALGFEVRRVDGETRYDTELTVYGGTAAISAQVARTAVAFADCWAWPARRRTASHWW